MRLNINQLVYDEESETYVEKSHKTELYRSAHTIHSSKIHDGMLSYTRRCGNHRQDDIKRKRQLERRYTKELRNLRIIEGWKQQEEQNNWWEEKDIDLPVQSFNEWLESHIA